MILTSFLAAVSQFLSDARFRGVLWRGIGLALVLLLAASALVIWGANALVGDSLTLPYFGTVTWVSSVVSWASVPLTLLLSMVLMVPVASAITSIFLDEVAQAVEDRHYPALPPATPVSLAEGLRDSVSFLGVMLLANLVALLVYLLLIPFAPLIFWALNGFLLGREYFTLAATRRVGRLEAKRLWRRHLPVLWVAGVLMAIPLSVPVVNLLVPVLGAATFTHLYHRTATRRSAA